MNKINNTKKDKQKEIEKEQFRRFANIYPQIPSGEIIYGDKPDVIIEGKDRRGIELTAFYIEDGALPESEQRQRERREKVVEEAHKAHIRNGGRPIELSFGFKKDYPIQGPKLLIEKLSKLAKVVENEESGEILKKAYKDIEELDFLYINSSEYSNPRWKVVQVYDGNLISLERLGKIIRDKEADSKNYQACDKFWLLITIDFMDHAQDCEIKIDGIDQIKSEIFDKIFLYKSVFNELKEIQSGLKIHPADWA